MRQENAIRIPPRGTALLIAFALSIALPASASRRPKADARPRTLEQANQVLAGRIACIDLFEDTDVRRATEVRVEPDFTYWKARGRKEQVLTSQVRRITIRRKHPVLRGVGLGLAAGILVGVVGAGSGGGTMLDAGAGAAALGISMGGGGVIGAVVGASAGKHCGRVVYQAPVDRSLTEPSHDAPGKTQANLRGRALRPVGWRAACIG